MRRCPGCPRLLTALVLIVPFTLAACDDGGDAAPADAMLIPDGDPPDAEPDAGTPPDASPDASPDAEVPMPFGPPECDPLVPQTCLLPWPSMHTLEAAPDHDTGYRVAPDPRAMPISGGGVPIDPAMLHRTDGFPLGTPIITFLPHLDAAALPGEESIPRSMDPETDLALFETTDDGLRPIPVFGELDARKTDPATRLLFIRPAVLLKENTRYVVALRRLVDLDGQPIAPSPAFAALRDGQTADAPMLADRQAGFDALFTDLEAIGWDRDDLTLAWDFHTASHRSLHGDLLFMRDDALEQVGPDGPEITIDRIEELDDDPNIALRIEGTMRAPHYLEPVPGFLGETAWVFRRGPDGMPLAEDERDVPFLMMVPRQAIDGPPQALVQYGHGLFGSSAQMEAEHRRISAEQEGYVYFALSLAGMSNEDVNNIIGITYDVNRFEWLADRVHQGLVESALLARAMKSRLSTLPELVERGITIDPDRLYYEGDSQGGIYGASLMALSSDLTRGMLGVPGQNYSTLAERSVDFVPFFTILDAVYAQRHDQAVVLALIQVLWDAVDPVSHYPHLVADPYPGNPPAAVIMATARGDHQVSVMTAEIVARSGVGVEVMAPYDPERTPGLIEPIPYPHTGSAIVNWVYENPWPEAGNTPPDDGMSDPHGRPRREPAYRRLMAHFFATGEIIDVCDGRTCPPR